MADDPGVTEEPSAEMLRVLREEIDPLGIRGLEFAPARERAGRLAACIAAEQDLIDRARCLSLRRDGNMGRAGIPILGFHWMPASVWRTAVASLTAAVARWCPRSTWTWRASPAGPMTST